MISAKAYILRERGLVPSLEEMKVDDNLLQGMAMVVQETKYQGDNE